MSGSAWNHCPDVREWVSESAWNPHKSCIGQRPTVQRPSARCPASPWRLPGGRSTSALEQGERRNAADTELRGRWGSASVFTFASLIPGSSWRRLVETAAPSSCTARTRAPRNDQQRQIAALHVARERRRRQPMGSPVNKGCWQRPQLGRSAAWRPARC